MTKEHRLELSAELKVYMALHPDVDDPANHVSFQPPEGSQILYPHIVYSRDPAYKLHADNTTYRRKDKYVVTYIDRKPDSLVFDALDKRTLCSHRASFVVDGLHHDVFDLYY